MTERLVQSLSVFENGIQDASTAVKIVNLTSNLFLRSFDEHLPKQLGRRGLRGDLHSVRRPRQRRAARAER